MAAALRVAVTGASGFIGQALVRRLADRGHEVLALSRTGRPVPAGVRALAVDYAQVPALQRALEGTHVLVHLGAMAHGRGGVDFGANDATTQALCRACVGAGTQRFVFLSSIGVNGTVTHAAPFTEADPPQPREPYALSKLRCEDSVRGAGLREFTILRPPLVYGPGAPGNFARLVRAVQNGWPLPLREVRNARSFLALENLLDLLELCLAHPAAANELFLAADADTVTTTRLVECIARGVGRPARLWRLPAPLVRTAATLGAGRLVDSLYGDLRVDSGKARRLLGWVPRVAAGDAIEHAARASTGGGR
jgi:nucleoside-diphosphate-sugar epimerase